MGCLPSLARKAFPVRTDSNLYQPPISSELQSLGNKPPEQSIMNLVPCNLKDNEMAVNNCVYISSVLAKNPAATIHVSIKHAILKCQFTADVPPKSIGIGKKLREYLEVDTVNPILVQPYQPAEEVEASLSFLEIDAQLIKPKVTNLVLNEAEIVGELLKKENGAYFNRGETKYLRVNEYLLSLRVTKLLPINTGVEQVVSKNAPGKLLPETQISLKLGQGADFQLDANQSQAKNIFRPDFSLEEMNIGGLDEELFNIFRRTFASRRYSPAAIKRFGIKHVKGILLFGPPGTGKTLIARQLSKALNVKDLKIVNGPQIFSRYVGESEKNIRLLFEAARADEARLGDQSPLHIIVFDEIDAICKQRGVHSGGSQVGDQVVNQLLTNIDGVEALNNIIVIGMTNRKDLIDEAILRPGRFEVHIEVSLPNLAGREQIFNIHTKKLTENKILDSKCQMHQLASQAKNYTGAQIEALVKCAVSHCISRTTNILDFSKELIIDEKKLIVEEQDFNKAMEEVKPQFGVDQDKFNCYLRGSIINYGDTFNQIMSDLHEAALMSDNNPSQIRSVLLHGPPGCGKTSIAAQFAKNTSFNFIKIITPQAFINMSDQSKVTAINKIFEDSYKTVNACILIDDVERLISYCGVGRRFSNHVLQALLVLLGKAPARGTCKLLVVATSSCADDLDELEIGDSFDMKVYVPPLKHGEIQEILQAKYSMNNNAASQISTLLSGNTIRTVLSLADLVEDRNNVEEWKQQANLVMAL